MSDHATMRCTDCGDLIEVPATPNPDGGFTVNSHDAFHAARQHQHTGVLNELGTDPEIRHCVECAGRGKAPELEFTTSETLVRWVKCAACDGVGSWRVPSW